MGTLPPELVDLIIDALSDDWRALAACAHVDQEWAPRARSHLRQGAVISIDSPDCPDLDDFPHIIHPSSTLAEDISVLSICGPSQPSISDLLLIPFPETLVLGHLPHLRSLTFRSFRVSDAGPLISALRSCKSLEALNLERMSAEPTAIGNLESDVLELAELEIPPSSFLVRLKTLCMRDCDSVLSETLLLPLALSFIHATGSLPSTAQSLTIRIRGPQTSHEPIVYTREISADVIGTTVPIPFAALRDYTDFDLLCMTIRRCHHIRRLVLRYEPGPATHQTGNAEFLMIFNRTTYDVSSGSAWDGAYQDVEVLMLVLPHEEPAWEQELGRFAWRVNVQRRTFPALGRVRVGMECEDGVEAEEGVRRIEAALQPLRDGGISVDVVALRTEEWESWAVLLP
ncbi:hypothetical protein VTO73DRAFT_7550 [Trametes versicolor]